MKTELKISELLAMFEASAEVMSKNFKSAVAAMRFSHNHDAMLPDYKRFIDQRAKLAAEYGTKNEDGGYTVSKDAMEEFASKLQPLLDEVVTVDLRKVDVDGLPGDVTGWHIAALKRVLSEPE